MSQDKQEVVVVDVKIPFVSMVVLLVKWAIAAVPALIILALLVSVIGMLFGGLFGSWFQGGMTPRGTI
ncbi:MAG: hypothetical protein EXR27_04340 [Betaproteobacteria bacterium]|nr:hypothetical protein [Betaproteobacteria bacterium]